MKNLGAEDYIEKLNEKIGGNDPELASCKMKLKLALTRRRGDLTCDSKRENRLLKVNPLDAKTLRYVSYTPNGVIYSKDEVIQNDLDVKLNLNCKSAGINLPLQRKMVLDVIQSKVDETPNDVILCNKILKSIKIKPVPYSDAAIWWLEDYIQKLSKT